MTHSIRPMTSAERSERIRRELAVPEDAKRFLRARLILKDLREKRLDGEITPQQYSTLRGQAIAGDVDGAVKGLAKIMRRNREQAEAGGETE